VVVNGSYEERERLECVAKLCQKNKQYNLVWFGLVSKRSHEKG
jgi:hypothetical protein